MSTNQTTTCFLLATLFFLSCTSPTDLPSPQTHPPSERLLRRWDVTVATTQGSYPSWFEIRSTDAGLAGSFVGQVGSVRPIDSITYRDGRLRFQLPVQYEPHPTDLHFDGGWQDNRLVGTTHAEDGTLLEWTAVAAPRLDRPAKIRWGEPSRLFNGRDLSGWKPRHSDSPHYWTVQDGVLTNTAKGSDLMTEQQFKDFKLSLEFRYPEGSNSGVYLRGRYELQIQDDYGKEPSSVHLAGVYGFLAPSVNRARPAGEWQSFEITLLGRYITVILNGDTVIQDQEIPGITGGALDSSEGEPGPILFQGDHGPISLRNVELIPTLSDST